MEKPPGKTLVVLATYNERENLPTLVEAILLAAPYVDLLIVDDNSPDGTADWVAEKSEKDVRITLLKREGKNGLGSAILDAMRFAMKCRYDYMLNLDADWSHPPEMIPRLIQTMEQGCDVAIGSRYVYGGKILGWPFYRKIMSRAVNLYARMLLRLPSRDNSGSFRCYRVKTLQLLDLSAIRSSGYSFFEEILYRLHRIGSHFIEVPITFTDRRFGSSKINRSEALRALWIIASLRFSK